MIFIQLISPLKVWMMNENDEEIVLSSQYAARCKTEILAALKEDEDRSRDMLLRGLMAYYPKDDEVGRNVLSARPSVKVDDNGNLVGVCTCCIHGNITDKELEILIDYISGQYSDGWDEGFEGNSIHTQFGYVIVSFWNRDPEWKMTVYNPTKEIEDAMRKANALLDELLKQNDKE